MNKIEKLIKELCPNGVEWKKIGEIAYISDYVSAGSFASIRENVTYKDNPDFAVLLRFADFSNGFDKSKFVYVDEHAYKFLSKSNLYPGDIVISNVGSCGLMFRCPDLGTKITLAPNSIVFRAENNAFFYYWLTTEKGQKDIERITSKSAMPKFNKTQFKEILVPYPPLPIQTEIVRILDKFVEQQEQLERLIELRKKQYEYYREEMLTPKEGEVWETKRLGEIAEVTKLAGFEFTEYVEYSDEGKIIALRGLNVKDGKLVLDDVKYIDNSNFSKLNRSKLLKNDLLYTYVGTVGQSAIIEEDDKYYLAPNVAMIRVKSQDVLISKYLLFYLLSSKFKNSELEKLTASSSMKNITMEKIRKFNIVFPSVSKQKDIINTLVNFESSITALTSVLEASKKRYEYYRDEVMRF